MAVDLQSEMQEQEDSLSKEQNNALAPARLDVEDNKEDAVVTTESAETVPVDAAPTKSRIAQVKVRWLRDDAISLNGRQYPKSSVDRLIQSAQTTLSNPDALPINCYISHREADKDDTTKLVGRVTEVWREGDAALAHIDISDTNAGRDIATLMQHGYLNTISLRATGGELQVDKRRGGIPQVGGQNLQLRGIDCTSMPGLENDARVLQVITESIEHAEICEVFDISPQSLLLETVEEQDGQSRIEEQQPMEETKTEENSAIPSMTSGTTQGTTDGPTDDAYHKRMYANGVPPMVNNNVTNSMADAMTTTLHEAHDHIAMVQGRACAPSRESAAGQKALLEAGKMISMRNSQHLDAAHDNIAHALGMQCEGLQNKKAPVANDMEDNMESVTPKESAPQMTPDQATKLLEAAGYKIERPKTEKELMLESIEAQRKAMEESMAEQRKAMEAQMVALQEQMKAQQAAMTAAQETPQRRSLVEGATPQRQDARPQIYTHGSYLKEQMSQIDLPRLADRSYPLPENVDVSRLIEEMKGPLLGQYEAKYGLGI